MCKVRVKPVNILWVLFLGAYLITVGGAFAEPVGETGKKVRVVTTLFPLYDFIRQVGGDRVDVTLLVPPGVEPHSFEPKPSDFVTINEADILLYTSDEMEPWVSQLLPAVTNQNLLIVTAANGLLRALSLTEFPGHDPHIWLNFYYDQHIVNDIVSDLVSFDEDGREYYAERGDAYKRELARLEQSYIQGLQLCRLRTIYYGGHVAFGNLAQKYDLEVVSPYKGFTPDAEPTPQSIAALIEGIRGSKARTVFYEELLDPKVARIVEEETDARIELLSAAHNVTADELANGVTFIKIMDENLAKLKSALECQ